MSKKHNQIDNEYSHLLQGIEKPSRYIGGEFGSIVKNPEDVAVSFALAFPDIYDVGMSHIGSAILYQTLNAVDWIAGERAYTPWVDREAQMRERGELLCTLESGRPLGDFDVVGFSLQYELSYTNILNMLDLANIPLLRDDRDDSHPLIVVGGPCAFNPEPIADYFDCALIGDAEESIIELCEIVKKAKESGIGRAELLEQIAAIEGAYVPSHFDVTYHEDGTIEAIKPFKKEYKGVKRRILADLDSSPFPTNPIVPFKGTVHDRVALEIARGCTRGCRFCQAGYIYRPVRERSPETIINIAEEAIKNSGYDEVSLLSLSTGDYCAIAPLLQALMKRYQHDHVAVSFPSLRVGSLTEELMEEIKKVRKTGFTLAPEAGTDRLRRVINKGITEEDLIDTTSSAFQLGWRLIKLYFMIGLPTETDEDVKAIINLAGRVKHSGKGTGGAEVTTSVSTFIPKPHTPFQWDEQLSIEETRHRHSILRDALRQKKIKFKWHDPEISFLEGVFARGDRRLGKVLAKAHELGCKFDGWSDHFNYSLWMTAFEACDVDPNWYLRKREQTEVLPWQHIDCGIPTSFFIDEYKNALAEGAIADCRDGSCHGCQLCDFETVKPIAFAAEPIEIERHPPAGEPVILARLKFAKTGRMRLVAHLDFMTVFQRALKRAKLPISFSQGFHPHPKTSFSEALPMGAESDAEIVDIQLHQSVTIEDIIERINAALPEGIKILEGEILHGKQKSPSASIESMTYRIALPDNPPEDLQARLDAFLAEESVIIEKKGKKGIQEYDLRANLFDLWQADDALYLKIGKVSPLAIAAYLLNIDIEVARALPTRKTSVELFSAPPVK